MQLLPGDDNDGIGPQGSFSTDGADGLIRDPEPVAPATSELRQRLTGVTFVR